MGVCWGQRWSHGVLWSSILVANSPPLRPTFSDAVPCIMIMIRDGQTCCVFMLRLHRAYAMPDADTSCATTRRYSRRVELGQSVQVGSAICRRARCDARF
eukprot:1240447-Rhodomonas_salina.5